jgi:hypothetical protein
VWGFTCNSPGMNTWGLKIWGVICNSGPSMNTLPKCFLFMRLHFLHTHMQYTVPQHAANTWRGAHPDSQAKTSVKQGHSRCHVYRNEAIFFLHVCGSFYQIFLTVEIRREHRSCKQSKHSFSAVSLPLSNDLEPNLDSRETQKWKRTDPFWPGLTVLKKKLGLLQLLAHLGTGRGPRRIQDAYYAISDAYLARSMQYDRSDVRFSALPALVATGN